MRFAGWWVLGMVATGCVASEDDPSDTGEEDPSQAEAVPGDDSDQGEPTDTREPSDSDTGLLPADHEALITVPTISYTSSLRNDSRVTCAYALRIPRSDVVHEEVTWTNHTEGRTLGQGNPFALTPALIEPGQRLRCRVVVRDVRGWESVRWDTKRLTSALPRILDVTLSPSSPYLRQTLTCDAQTNHTYDLPVTTKYTWTNVTRGTSVGTGTEWFADPSQAEFGDVIACEVEVSDELGTVVEDSATTTLGEHPPVLTPLTLDPIHPEVGDTVRCETTLTHPDGLPVQRTTTWDNLTRAHQVTGDALELDPAHFETGEQVRCTVTATSPNAEASQTLTFTINEEGNQPPVITDIQIHPPGPVEIGEPVTCTAQAVDPDGTEPILTYRWSNLRSSSWRPSGPTVTPPFGPVRPGDTLRCTATATDGTLSDTATAEVEAVARPPTLHLIQIAPRPLVSPEGLIECHLMASSAHDQPLTYTHTWRNERTGEILGDHHRLDLSQVSDLVDGDVVRCEAVVSDFDQDVHAEASVIIDATTRLGEVAQSPTLGPIRYIPPNEYTRGCDPDREPTMSGHAFSQSELWITGVLWASQPMEEPCDLDRRASAQFDTPAHRVTLTRPLWVTEGPVDHQMLSDAGRPVRYSWASPHPRHPWPTTWTDAVDFANLASQQDGLPPCYDLQACTHHPVGSHSGLFAYRSYVECPTVDVLSPSGSVLDCEGWRLPTDAEWEYLARGGETRPLDLPHDVWQALDAPLRGLRRFSQWSPPPSTDCTFAPNAFGLCDGATTDYLMWVWDSRAPYPDPPPAGGLTDPEAPPDPGRPIRRMGEAPYAKVPVTVTPRQTVFLVRTAP